MSLIKRMTGRRGSGKNLTDADLKNVEEAIRDGRDGCESSLGDLFLQWPEFDDPDRWGARVIGFDEGDCVVEVILDLADVADHYHPDAFAEAVKRNPRFRATIKQDNWPKEDRQDFPMLAKHYAGVARERKQLAEARARDPYVV